MSRHVERRISLAVTRRLVWTALTPNGMTGVSPRRRPRRRALLPLRGTGVAGGGRPPLPPAFDPRRLRRGDRAAQVPRVVGRGRPRFLGRQRRARLRLRLHGPRLEHRVGARRGRSSSAWWRWPSTLVAAFAVEPHKVDAGPAQRVARSAGARMADALANRDFIYLVVAARRLRPSRLVPRPRRGRHARSSCCCGCGPTAAAEERLDVAGIHRCAAARAGPVRPGGGGRRRAVRADRPQAALRDRARARPLLRRLLGLIVSARSPSRWARP